MALVYYIKRLSSTQRIVLDLEVTKLLVLKAYIPNRNLSLEIYLLWYTISMLNYSFSLI